jgi:hypothetical protein
MSSDLPIKGLPGTEGRPSCFTSCWHSTGRQQAWRKGQDLEELEAQEQMHGVQQVSKTTPRSGFSKLRRGLSGGPEILEGAFSWLEGRPGSRA